MLLKDQNLLITGCARGIGAAMVEVCAREGANIWAMARSRDEVFENRLQTLAEQYGVRWPAALSGVSLWRHPCSRPHPLEEQPPRKRRK